jgi:hypothetical protein
MKNMLGVILLVLSPSLTIADEPAWPAFGSPMSYLVGDRPQSITTSDLNGDGILDVVTANDYSDDVSVLPGIGDGTFGEAVNYDVGSGPQDVTIADFDKDGALDMIVANRDSNDVSILYGDGAGSFEDAVTVRTDGRYPFAIASGDFNGDTWIDFAVANGFSHDVTTVANDQGIGFFHQRVYPVGRIPEDLVMADFNKDGLADFATSNDGTDDVTVRLSRPSHLGFGPLASYPVGRRPLGIASGDLNLDGHVDLVNANRYSDSVTVLLGNGNGTFEDGVDYAGGEGVRDVAIGDLNLDGIPDLVMAHWGHSVVFVVLGYGDGTFAPPIWYYIGQEGSQAVAVGDVDGDGRPDILATRSGWDLVAVLLNETRTPVEFIVKPDGPEPVVNPRSNGVIPVAIIGSPSFDVDDVDVSTLAFGPGGAGTAHPRGHREDVNGDGVTDLKLHFRTTESGIACGDNSVMLIGETYDGTAFEGSDEIATVGCPHEGRPSTVRRVETAPRGTGSGHALTPQRR